MTGYIRVRSDDQADRDHADRQTVVGEMGYQYHFGPNEAKVFADNNPNRIFASNATVKFGMDTQQSAAPAVKADVDDDPVGVS